MAIVGYFNPKRDSVSQLDAFNSQQCEYIYHDEETLFENTHGGDVVVVEALSCAGADLVSALGFVHRLAQHGIGFVSVGDQLDSRTSEDLPRVMEAMYQLTKNQPRQPSETSGTGSGTSTSIRHGGRGRVPVAPEVIDEALARYQRGDTVKAICEELGFSQGTLYRYIKQRGVTRGA